MIKRLLIITRHRLNENNGGANGSKGFIRCFSSLFEDCSVIYPEFEDADRFIPSKYKHFPCLDTRSRIRKGLDCYRGELSPMASFTKAHLSKHHYDVIVIDHSFIAARLIKAVKTTSATIITIHHNVERDYLHDNRKEYSPLFRWPYIHFAMKAERDCLQLSDLNLTVTEHDAEEFKSWYPEKRVYNWGNFEYMPIPDKIFAAKDKKKTFIITGSLCFIQSLQPILEFIRRYWPIVKEKHPDATLTIAGRNPAKELFKECAKDTTITIIPNPKDMAALVCQAEYYICPINAGSGRKLRVIDGLKQGLPVMCHEVSMSGYESMIPANCLFTYHDENTFNIALNRMLSTAPSPDTVYQTYQANFSTEAGVNRLRSILEQEKIL